MEKIKHKPYGPYEKYIKRPLDLICSLIAIIVFSWLYLIIAILVRVKLGSPVIFTQDRPGKDEKIFKLYKFRTMTDAKDENGKLLPDSERLTKFGKMLRATSLDELPEAFNIAKGDMSIVGPRPERWEHDEMYAEDIPEWPLRLKVKGGLTGYAQVYGKYNTTALDKLKLDLFYITNYSLVLDIQILFETVKIIFQKESTEGFSEERGKEMHDGLDSGIVQNGK